MLSCMASTFSSVSSSKSSPNPKIRLTFLCPLPRRAQGLGLHLPGACVAGADNGLDLPHSHAGQVPAMPACAAGRVPGSKRATAEGAGGVVEGHALPPGSLMPAARASAATRYTRWLEIPIAGAICAAVCPAMRADRISIVCCGFLPRGPFGGLGGMGGLGGLNLREQQGTRPAQHAIRIVARVTFSTRANSHGSLPAATAATILARRSARWAWVKIGVYLGMSVLFPGYGFASKNAAAKPFGVSARIRLAVLDSLAILP